MGQCELRQTQKVCMCVVGRGVVPGKEQLLREPDCDCVGRR